MHSSAVHLLLIAAIVACPIACDAGVCCTSQHAANDARMQQACCPACCEKTDSQSGSSQPRPAEKHPCDSGKCQGICSGAVIESHVEFSVTFAETSAVCIAAPASMDAQAGRSFVAESPPADGTPASGRIVRVLHMSLLC